MRIRFNQNAFREIRHSADGLVKNEADELAQRANSVPSTTDPEATEPYYEVQEASDADRPRYRVRTTGDRSAKHEAKTNALQRNI